MAAPQHQETALSPSSPSFPDGPIALPISPDEELPSKAIPWRIILPVMLYRMTDGMGYLFIFPFITALITSFDVDPGRIGLYSGIAEGTTMLTEAIMATVWAKLSSKYQRRYLLIGGLIICILPTALLGVTSKVWHVVLIRGITGMNSAAVLGRTVVVEASNLNNRAKIFAIFTPTFALGGMIGTFLGGELAHPYGRLPSWMGGNSSFFQTWPFLLPCLAVAGLETCTTIVGIFYLQDAKGPGRDTTIPTEATWDGGGSFWDAVKVPNFLVATVIFGAFQLGPSKPVSLPYALLINLVIFSFDSVYAVYTYTGVHEGGLQLPVDIIGIVLSGSNLSYIVLTPLVLPLFTDRFGSTKTLRLVLFAWPVLALSLPFTQSFAGAARPFMYTLVVAQTMIKTMGYFARPLCDVLVMGAFDKYPHLLVRGSAISMVSGAGARAIGPAVSGWLYSIPTQFRAGTLERQIYWIVFLAFTLTPILLSRQIPSDGEAKGRIPAEADSGERGEAGLVEDAGEDQPLLDE